MWRVYTRPNSASDFFKESSCSSGSFTTRSRLGVEFSNISVGSTETEMLTNMNSENPDFEGSKLIKDQTPWVKKPPFMEINHTCLE
jgi:hypothetical protein